MDTLYIVYRLLTLCLIPVFRTQDNSQICHEENQEIQEAQNRVNYSYL